MIVRAAWRHVARTLAARTCGTCSPSLGKSVQTFTIDLHRPEGRDSASHPPTTQRLFLAALALVACAGCAATPKPIFVAAASAMVWPPPPDTPRIRYLGEIRGESSLGRVPRGLDALREILTGPPPALDFVAPTSVAASGQRVYVTDRSAPGGAALLALDLDARTISAWRPSAPAMQWPIDVTIAGDRLAVADAAAAVVFLFDLTGRFVGALGGGVLQRPAAVAWDPSTRELWVVDSGLHACVVFDRSGSPTRRVGGRGAGAGQFNFPAGICVYERAAAAATTSMPDLNDDDRAAPAYADAAGSGRLVAVADAMNFRVQVLDPSGAPRLRFGRKGDAAGDFSLPRDVAADSGGRLYVLDTQFENVQVFDDRGRLLMALGQEGRGPGEFNLPGGLSIDAQNRIWVADTYNRRVQVFQCLTGGAEIEQ